MPAGGTGKGTGFSFGNFASELFAVCPQPDSAEIPATAPKTVVRRIKSLRFIDEIPFRF
jgi:hypothetical protein